MIDLQEMYLKQLDIVISAYQQYVEKNYGSHWSTNERSHFEILAAAAIDRIAGSESVYGRQMHTALTERDAYSHHRYVGIVRALRDDVANGFLINIKEFVHGEMFSDFLDMADYLVNQGFKDAAAVMRVELLEAHLRQLCIKNTIDIEILMGTDIRPKRAEQLNADLAKKKVYGILEQKQITAWLDLRNKATHAKYGEYTREHVSLMLLGIRNFISSYPA